MNDLVSLTELIIKGLVVDSESVSVKEFESDEDNTILIEVMVSSEDMPKVIGHGGKTINSIVICNNEIAIDVTTGSIIIIKNNCCVSTFPVTSEESITLTASS